MFSLSEWDSRHVVRVSVLWWVLPWRREGGPEVDLHVPSGPVHHGGCTWMQILECQGGAMEHRGVYGEFYVLIVCKTGRKILGTLSLTWDIYNIWFIVVLNSDGPRVPLVLWKFVIERWPPKITLSIPCVLAPNCGSPNVPLSVH